MNIIIQVIIALILGGMVGFMVGYFMWLIVRYLQKKNAIKKIEKQNLKFENCEHESLIGINKNVEEKTQDRNIESTAKPNTEGNRERKTRFGSPFN